MSIGTSVLGLANLWDPAPGDVDGLSANEVVKVWRINWTYNALLGQCIVDLFDKNTWRAVIKLTKI